MASTLETETEWIMKDPPAAALAQLEASEESSRLSPLVKKLLALRGHTEEFEVQKFLQPRLQDLSDPFLLPDMRQAVERILAAVDAKETVVLYGDYDVDGVTSLTMLKSTLVAYGLEVFTFLPNRMGEGYGVSKEGIERSLEQCAPQLFIAVDCGTSSAKEIALLNERGIDVIVLDHHECPPSGKPECVAVVNPKLGDDFHYFCSAGVVFKLAHALLKERWLDTFDLRDWLDIVAVGTVADIVPLVDENRLLVRKGLRQLEHTKHVGLSALKTVASLTSPLNSMDIGFRLGPRLNAAGRLDTAQLSLDLLLTDDEHEAKQLAETLDRHNRSRQSVEQRIHEEAEAQLFDLCDPADNAGIVLGSDDWHPGVVGIVASRIMRRYHRPTFIIAFDEDGIGKGSGRSVEGISLVDIINQSSDYLIKGGGHDMAAGISIEKGNLEAFREHFAERVSAMATNGELMPRLNLDVEASLKELDLATLDSYEMLQPFGSANPEPVFYARGVQPTREPRIISEKHLKLYVQQDGAERESIWFNAADFEIPRPPWDIAFTIFRNTFRGRTSVQLSMKALRKSPD